jgi:hypothetical protein
MVIGSTIGLTPDRKWEVTHNSPATTRPAGRGTLMQRFIGTIKAIASVIARLVQTAANEAVRRRRRANTFRALSQRRAQQPFFLERRHRTFRMVGRL